MPHCPIWWPRSPHRIQEQPGRWSSKPFSGSSSPQSEAADSLSAEAANCGRYCIGSFQDGDWPNALQEITKCCLSSLSSAKGQNEAATNSGSRCQEPKLNLRCEWLLCFHTASRR
jgi:hypothetical protein